MSDYKNVIHPKRGFNKLIIDELKRVSDNFVGIQRYVAVCFDEMKIQSGLVWDKVKGELIGYIDLGDPNINYTSLTEADHLATHVLVLFVQGLGTDLKFPLANFGTIQWS